MLMRFAFGKLNENLPHDRAGFYAEALQPAEHAACPRRFRQSSAANISNGQKPISREIMHGY